MISPTRNPIRCLLVVLLSLAGVVGCDSQVRSGFPAMATGLSQDEVRALLGDPSMVIPGETGGEGVRISGPRWQYGDNLSTITTAAAFPRTVPDRVWVVWFDVDGRVSTWREPLFDSPSSVESAPGVDGRSTMFTSPTPPRDR
ncbi:MAG: outer membrane protein assembly factor BamE [Phycisphaera sp.]|nr:outer membrane protein assembly factor BamE [Phycisphaera sp.]